MPALNVLSKYLIFQLSSFQRWTTKMISDFLDDSWRHQDVKVSVNESGSDFPRPRDLNHDQLNRHQLQGYLAWYYLSDCLRTPFSNTAYSVNRWLATLVPSCSRITTVVPPKSKQTGRESQSVKQFMLNCRSQTLKTNRILRTGSYGSENENVIP